MALLDVQGIILDANEAMAQWFGRNLNELIGIYGWDLLPPDIAKHRKSCFGQVIESGKHIRFEDESQGTWFDNVFFPIFGPQEKVSKVGIMASEITERKQAEEALRESEKKYRNLFESLQEGIWVIDKDSNTTFVNVPMANMLGYPVDEMIGKHLFSFMDEQAIEISKRNLERRKRGIKEQHEFEFIKKNGARIYVLIETKPLTDDDGNYTGAIACVLNITERKQAEESLRDSRNMLQTVLDSIPSAVFWKDRDSIYLGGNLTWLEAAGLRSSEEVVGKSDYDLPWKKKQADLFREDDKRVMESGIPEYGIIEPYRKADGTDAWAKTNKIPLRDTEGNVTGVLGTYEDITEQVTAAEALGESEEKYRSLVESSEDSIYLVDKHCNYLFMNKKHLSRFGLPMDEILGRNYIDFHSDKATKDFVGKIEQVIESGESVSYEHKSEKDGRYFIRTLSPVRGPAKEINVVTVISKDITDRKQAEETMQKSKKELGMITDNLPALVSYVDMEGRYRFVNKQYKEWFGMSDSDILGKHYQELLGKEASKIIKGYIDNALSGRRVTYEHMLPYQHGGGRWVKADYVPDEDQDGNVKGFFALVHDITERKQAEETLRESEFRYSSLFENMMNGFAYCKILLDENNQPIDFVYLEVNDAFEKLTGLRKEDIVGEKATEAIPGIKDSHPELLDIYGKVALTGEETEFEIYFEPLEIWLYISVYSSQKGYFVAVFENITERKKAETALHESEKKYRSLFENSKDAVYITSREGTVVDVNEAFMDLFGYSREEIKGLNIRDIYVNPEERSVFQREIERREFVKDYALKFRKKDEQEMDCLVTATVRHADDGAVLGCQGIIRDITDIKRAEEERIKLQAQLFQSQKMESLGNLVAGVAHEINNPNSLIMLNVPILQDTWRDIQPIMEQHALKEPRKKYGGLTYAYLDKKLGTLLSDMHAAAARISSITKNLKDFARPSDIGNKQPMQINDGVGNAVRLAQTTLRKSGIDLEFDLAEDLPLIQGNLSSIEQIVLNLIINALEAIDHDHGKIKLTTGVTKKDARVFISIADNGRGIDPSISDKIFDPFFTTRQAEGGTGLGLSITYTLVRAHDGEITFESKEGKGTTFTVSFPTQLSKKPAKILVVDDDKSIRKMLIQALNKAQDYAVEEASNGTEALVKLGTYRPDLLILDIFMPGMDGVEVCRALREEPELSDMKVVIITGFPDNPKLKQVAEMGFTNIYTKPLEINDFIKQVDNILKNKVDSRQ